MPINPIPEDLRCECCGRGGPRLTIEEILRRKPARSRHGTNPSFWEGYGGGAAQRRANECIFSDWVDDEVLEAVNRPQEPIEVRELLSAPKGLIYRLATNELALVTMDTHCRIEVERLSEVPGDAISIVVLGPGHGHVLTLNPLSYFETCLEAMAEAQLYHHVEPTTVVRPTAGATAAAVAGQEPDDFPF